MCREIMWMSNNFAPVHHSRAQIPVQLKKSFRFDAIGSSITAAGLNDVNISETTLLFEPVEFSGCDAVYASLSPPPLELVLFQPVAFVLICDEMRIRNSPALRCHHLEEVI